MSIRISSKQRIESPGLEYRSFTRSSQQWIFSWVSRGLTIIDKYYSKTDESIMWKTAMILHPRYKLNYFRNQNWLPEWIKTAKQSARDTWKLYYKPTITETVSTTIDSDDPFADVDNFGRNFEQDPFEVYIQAPQFDCGNPISHWTAKLDQCSPKSKTKKVTPEGALTRMALDFLLAPAASTDVERVFSHGGLVVSKHHHNLSAESTRANVVLNSWSKLGIVPRSRLIKVFNDKSRRNDREGADVGAVLVDGED
ncbi:uncharacterized protein ARMOST_22268 [Armillaria ostoyae]|uniref:HAT C-terminal dimerisation domain-containing protein n=1 Tax=Armillaria ostoyae TaxID=47428 RepID=A0A284SCD7_ARMOS|nr:uncharacterized protein ARMOST_22268 [Armillaria ostoyae]